MNTTEIKTEKARLTALFESGYNGNMLDLIRTQGFSYSFLTSFYMCTLRAYRNNQKNK